MSFECTFCKNPGAICPALVDSVTYDLEKDLLVEKVVLCGNLFLCRSCCNDMRGLSITKQHEFFAGALPDARIVTIFQGAISDFFYRPLVQILKYCIVVRDSETIQKMQMKDHRVPFLLKMIFCDFLRSDYFNDFEFILSQLSIMKVKAECLLSLADFIKERSDVELTRRTFLRAFDYARQVSDEEEKNYLLIRVGYGIAKLTVSLIPSLRADEIAENISQVKMIISYLSIPMPASVDTEKNNILILCYVAKLLGEERFVSARLVSGVMSREDLIYAVRTKIMILEGAVN